MKLVSKFLNLLMIAILFCLTTVTEFCVYNLIALPSGDSGTIALVQKDTDEDGYVDNVTYFDTFSFWGDDIKESVTREPRFLVRSWFTWDWWQNGMKWADVAIEAVIGAVVPIVAPMYEVKEIQYFYTSDQPVHATIGDGEYSVQGLCVLSTEEYKKLYSQNEEYDPEFVHNFHSTHGTYFAYYENEPESVSDDVSIVTTGKILKIQDDSVEILTSWTFCNGSANFVSNKWKKENKTFINVLMKINKYNSVDEDGKAVYSKWIHKFMVESKGQYVIKSSACALYFQFYLAVILSLWFNYQNPIVITRNEKGEDEVSGGFRRRERKPKEAKEKKRHLFRRKKAK